MSTDRGLFERVQRRTVSRFTITFFIALALSPVVAHPGDWAPRHSSREVANALNLANGIALVAIIALTAELGLAHGLGQMLGLLSGNRDRPATRRRSGQPQMGMRSGVQLTVPFGHQ